MTPKNSLNDSYDVIILGAGPAGSSASYFLSKHGLKALLVDSQKFPREKLCGGLIAEDILRHLRDHWDIEFDNPNLGLPFQSGKLFYKKELIKTIQSDLAQFNMVMRADFDYFLVKQAVEEGVEFLDSTRVTEINEFDRTITIRDKKISFNYLIGADGIPSFVAKTYGLTNGTKSDINSNNAFAYEIHVPRGDVVNEELFKQPWIFFGDTKGYGWTFPKENILSVGIGAIGKENVSKQDLIDLFNYLDIGYDPKTIKGHYIPYGMPKKKIYKNHCFLVGDAANLCDPTTAKGIGYALESGRFAAQAILNNRENIDKAGKEYEKLITANIRSDLKYGMRINWFLVRDRFMKLGMQVIKNSESVGQKTLLLVAGKMTFKEFYWTIIKRLPKYGFQVVKNKILGKSK